MNTKHKNVHYIEILFNQKICIPKRGGRKLSKPNIYKIYFIFLNRRTNYISVIHYKIIRHSYLILLENDLFLSTVKIDEAIDQINKIQS